MSFLRLNLGRCLLVLMAWLALNVDVALGNKPARQEAIWVTVSGSIGWIWLLAAAFVTAVVLSSDRRALGVRLPEPLGTVRLAWLPCLYAGTACLLALAGSPLPGWLMATVLLNTALVALSEEVMFRGILLYGLMTRLHVLPAVLVSSAIFGAVHALNFLATGEMATALWQALAAGLQGVGYAAVRLRTQSLLPMVVLHALYDCGLILLAVRAHPATEITANAPWLGILLVAPVCVYGLFLLRKDAIRPGPLSSPKPTL